MGLGYSEGDIEFRKVATQEDNNGGCVVEYVVSSAVLDLGTKALETVRELLGREDSATPYSRFKKVLCFRVMVPKGKSPPTDQDLKKVADAIRDIQPPSEEKPCKKRWPRR